MAGGDSPIALAGEFPKVDRAAWEALIGDIDALRSTTYDGITIEPLYTSADSFEPAGRPGSARHTRGRTAAGTRADGWDIRQVVDASWGRGAAVADLERGATSVLLRLPDEPGRAFDDERMERALEGVLWNVAPVVLDADRCWAVAGEVLCDIWDRQGVDPTSVSGSFGADPFGLWASNRSQVDLESHLVDFLGAAFRAPDYPNMRLVTIDGTRFHDAGASDAQELGYAVAVLVATLPSLVHAVGVLDAFGQVEFRFAATADQFATIAKFRAARRLWARVADIAGVPEAAANAPLHAVSSSAMMTRYDPAVNMLRATMACFAAGVAGADAITVLPYDYYSSSGGSELGRRLARNTQSVLAMESNLTRVIDPAGGSWYVERLTDQLARAAWDVFQEVEQAGGFRAAVEAGMVNERIAEVRQRRSVDVDRRHAPITGVTEFPNIGEVPPAVFDSPVEEPADGSLVRHRWAEDFEALRQRVDTVAAQGARPSIMLATLGAPAEFAARAMFAKNLFEVAGITTMFGPVTRDVTEIVDAFASSSTRVVCICSNDANYADGCAALAKTLAAAGATRIYLAGEPRDVMDELRASGVTHTITAGADARAALADLLDHLAIP